MEIKIFDTYEQMGQFAADIIEETMKSKDKPILGFATGATPISTYNALIEKYREGKISFKSVTSFNLDEYCTIDRDDKNSYYTFMHENLFNHVDIDEKNVNVPCGNPENVVEYCKGYDNSIEKMGGVDVQILGIGRNGHIGFNEPSDSFTMGTYKVELTQSTIEANKIYFPNEDAMPRQAITMGIGTIMKAKKIILLANGESKAHAIHDMVKGDVSPKCPASVLQNHPNVVVILDKAAASLL